MGLMDDVLLEMDEKVEKTPTKIVNVPVSETVSVMDNAVISKEEKKIEVEVKPTKEEKTKKILPTNGSVIFNSTQYKQYIDILSNVAKVSVDVVVKNSFIRQKMGGMVYSIDLTKLVGSDSFNSSLVVLKEKVNLLKVFVSEDSSVSLFQEQNGNRSAQVFHDDNTMFKITNPSDAIIKDVFQKEELFTELDKSVSENILFDINLNKYIAKIKTFIESFGSAVIDIKCANGTIEFNVQSSTKDMNAVLMTIDGIDPKLTFSTNMNPLALISFDFDKAQDIRFSSAVFMKDKDSHIIYRIENSFFGIAPIAIYQKVRIK